MTDLMNELLEEQEGFTIDNESKALWALRKIAAIEAEAAELEAYHKAQIEKNRKETESSVQHLKMMLYPFFEAMPHKKTKTQESASLLGFKMALKYEGVTFERDNEQLIAWLESNDLTDLVKVEKKADWATLKKRVTVSGEDVVDAETGEVIKGVTAAVKPAEFVITEE